MSKEAFDPVAFYEKHMRDRGFGIFGLPDDTGLRALAAESAKQQARRDAELCLQSAAEPSSMWEESGCWAHSAECCAQAIEREADLG